MNFEFNRILLAGLATMIMLSLSLSCPLNAEQLGRLFLTPGERKMLDEIRYASPVQEYEKEIITELTFDGNQTGETDEQIDIGRLTVNGLVYRKNGKSTAWVNEMSNYDLNENTDNFIIDNYDISPEKLSISIPKKDMVIDMKVGETYIPGIGEITDVLHEEDKAGIEIP